MFTGVGVAGLAARSSFRFFLLSWFHCAVLS